VTNPAIPFVVGCTRSGTSLLTVLLDRHSRLAMMPETHLLYPLAQDPPGWRMGPTHEHLLTAVWHRSWYRLRDLQFEPGVVLKRMQAHPCTPEGLLCTLLQLWAERAGKSVAGEKTPQHIQVVDRIVSGIPGSVVTVIVRDGRAVVQSRSRHRPAGSRDDDVDAWIEAARLADRWLAEFPERVRLVRFEELAAAPATVMESVMASYGLSFETGQLMPSGSPTFRRWEDRFKRDAEGPVDSGRIDAWRSAEATLSLEQLGRMAPWLERFGYPAPTRMTRNLEMPQATARPGPVRPRAAGRAALPVLFIGAHRAATSSLASWLATDSAVAAPPERQPHLLVTQWPITRAEWEGACALGSDARSDLPVVTEHAPYYLAHPDAARRARRVLPDARIVVLFRDPVARAFSHWLNEWRAGTESLPFPEALEAETERLGTAETRLASEEGAVSFAHVHYSYALRGRYAAQLARWYAEFPSEQILPLVTEEVLEGPASAWTRLRSHLFLPESPVPELPHLRGLAWPVTPAKLLGTREAQNLRAILGPEVERLETLLGRGLPWGTRARV